ncbi:hypothetical protein D3C80_498790 [compost metagenome]
MFQLGIGQLLIGADHRHGIRTQPGLGGNRLAQGLGLARLRQGIALLQGMQPGIVKQAKTADCRVRLVEQGPQQVLEALHELCAGLRRKTLAQVEELDRQRGIEADGQVHGVVGDIAATGLAKAQAGLAALLQALVHRVVFKHDDAIEQGLPPLPGPALDIGQRRLFMVTGFQVVGLQLRQPLVDTDLRLHGLDDRQGVDEQAEHFVGPGQGGRSTGDHRTETDRLLAAVTLQQQQPGGLYQGVGGDAQALCSGLEYLGLRFVPFQVQRIMALQAGRRLRADTAGQQGWPFKFAQALLPERLAADR